MFVNPIPEMQKIVEQIKSSITREYLTNIINNRDIVVIENNNVGIKDFSHVTLEYKKRTMHFWWTKGTLKYSYYSPTSLPIYEEAPFKDPKEVLLSMFCKILVIEELVSKEVFELTDYELFNKYRAGETTVYTNESVDDVKCCTSEFDRPRGEHHFERFKFKFINDNLELLTCDIKTRYNTDVGFLLLFDKEIPGLLENPISIKQILTRTLASQTKSPIN